MNALQATLNGYNALGSDLDQNGNTSGPQFAAFTPPSAVPALTGAELAPIVAAAKANWVAAGADAADVNAVRVEVADLPDGGKGQLPVLGYTTDVVRIQIQPAFPFRRLPRPRTDDQPAGDR
jgi:hypothetical protein